MAGRLLEIPFLGSGSRSPFIQPIAQMIRKPRACVYQRGWCCPSRLIPNRVVGQRCSRTTKEVLTRQPARPEDEFAAGTAPNLDCA